MASIFAPVLYLAVVFGGLAVFSYFYRKSTRTKQLEPYFPSHPERDLYISLLQQKDPPAFDGLLKAALIRRAMADYRRALKISEDKTALQNLLQKGAIGDDLWNSFLQAEKEQQAEVLEILHEANSFAQGWAQFIFKQVQEMVANEDTKKLFDDIPKERAKAQLKYGKNKMKKLPAPSSAKTATDTNGTHAAESKAVSPSTAGQVSPPIPSPEIRPKSPSGLNGSLVPPSVTDGESVGSMSENETSGTPSAKKKSGKKGKKRK